MECAGVVKDFAYFSQRRILNCYNTAAPYDLLHNRKNPRAASKKQNTREKYFGGEREMTPWSSDGIGVQLCWQAKSEIDPRADRWLIKSSSCNS